MVYKDATRNSKNPRMDVAVVVGGSAVNFVGTNYSGEAGTPQLYNYALGVLDKETGVLKMVPIAANKAFRLEPIVSGVEQPENEMPDVADTTEEKAEKFRNVTRMYSTKKNIRKVCLFSRILILLCQHKKMKSFLQSMLKSIILIYFGTRNMKLRQTGDAGAQEDMEHKLKGIKISREALEAIDSTTNARNIPPYDLEAEVAEMAYPLDKIILKGEWDYLQDIFELVQGGSDLTPDIYPSFVCNRVDNLHNAKDESNKRRMGGILSYITHIIMFKDRHSMDGVSSAKHHKLPTILSQKFSTMFASTEDKRIPEEKLNLRISYVLVLSLFADNFRSDISDIAKDLRMNPLN